MAIELVVFDLAGTTIRDADTVAAAFRATLAAAGVSAEVEQINAVMGLPKPEALRQLLPAAATQRIEELHADFVTRMLAAYEEPGAVEAMPHAEEVFAQLRQAGVRVALNTGFSRPIVDALLRRLKWGSLVDATVSSDEVARGRPHPDMILKLMETLAISDPKRVAKVGDTPADLGEGQAAGCGLNIGITHGTHRRAQLEKFPHTQIIDSLTELVPLVLAAKA